MLLHLDLFLKFKPAVMHFHKALLGLVRSKTGIKYNAAVNSMLKKKITQRIMFPFNLKWIPTHQLRLLLISSLGLGFPLAREGLLLNLRRVNATPFNYLGIPSQFPSGAVPAQAVQLFLSSKCIIAYILSSVYPVFHNCLIFALFRDLSFNFASL